jgi:hypothetical protein
LQIEAFGVKDDLTYAQCPRCRNYSSLSNGVDNYDGLCDRCCRTLINCFPEHNSVYSILEYNRTKYGQSLDNLPEYIEKLKNLKAVGSNLDVFE